MSLIETERSAPEIHVLNRGDLYESGGIVYRGVPCGDFDDLLLPNEALKDLNGERLTERLYEGLRSYTTPGDETHPQIDIIDFDVQTVPDAEGEVAIDGKGLVTIQAPFVEGPNVISMKDVLEDWDDATSLSVYANAFESLHAWLTQKTAELVDTPGSLVWREATIKQFLFILPHTQVMAGDKLIDGGSAGAFLATDIDPRHTRVPFQGAPTDDLNINLFIHSTMLEGDLARLYELGVFTDPEQAELADTPAVLRGIIDSATAA